MLPFLLSLRVSSTHILWCALSLQILCHMGFQNGNIAARFEVSWFSLLRPGKKEEFQGKDQTETQLVAVVCKH